MAVVQMKLLKPTTLKQKEMRLELLNGLRKAANLTEADYKKTVATWKNKPKFEKVISLTGSRAEYLVGTNDQIYQYVDEGTRPHLIFPKKAKVLRFSTGGSPKTQPNVIGSSSGSTGSNVVFTNVVNHPGTKPRNFSRIINEANKRKFKDFMHEAMREARKKSGHAI